MVPPQSCGVDDQPLILCFQLYRVFDTYNCSSISPLINPSIRAWRPRNMIFVRAHVMIVDSNSHAC